MKYFLKYRAVISEFAVLLIFYIYTFFTINSDMDCPENFIKDYFDIGMYYKIIDKGKVIFQTFPVIIFFFYHGTFFCKEWRLENIYKLVRYRKRRKCCVKSMIQLFLISVFMSFVFTTFLYFLYAFKSGDKKIYADYFIFILFGMTAIYYFTSLLFSFISLNLGSLYGCFGTFLIWSLLLVFSLYLSYECENKAILLIFRLVFPSVEFFYCIISGDKSCLRYFIPVLQIFVLSIANGLYIQRIDIGLIDKEDVQAICDEVYHMQDGILSV